MGVSDGSQRVRSDASARRACTLNIVCVVAASQSPSERRMRHLRMLQSLEQRRALGDVSNAELAYHARAALPDSDARTTAARTCSRASIKIALALGQYAACEARLTITFIVRRSGRASPPCAY